MNLKNKYLKLKLLLVPLCLSLSVFANTIVENKVLQGKWVLESVSARNVQDSQNADLDSLGITVYPEMLIYEDSITLVSKNGSQKIGYTTRNDFLWLGIPYNPFYAEWALNENKLYLEWVQDIPNESKSIIILLLYRRKINGI